jgi:shikimate dehydrogenase
MQDGDPLPDDPILLASSVFVGDVIAGHGVTPMTRVGRDAASRRTDRA